MPKPKRLHFVMGFYSLRFWRIWSRAMHPHKSPTCRVPGTGMVSSHSLHVLALWQLWQLEEGKFQFCRIQKILQGGEKSCNLHSTLSCSLTFSAQRSISLSCQARAGVLPYCHLNEVCGIRFFLFYGTRWRQVQTSPFLHSRIQFQLPLLLHNWPRASIQGLTHRQEKQRNVHSLSS